MRVITRLRLMRFVEQLPNQPNLRDIQRVLDCWFSVVRASTWSNLEEVRLALPNVVVCCNSGDEGDREVLFVFNRIHLEMRTRIDFENQAVHIRDVNMVTDYGSEE